MDFGLTSSDKFWRELLKSHLTSTIVEANLELVEHSRAAEEVETNAKALRKTNGNRHTISSSLGTLSTDGIFSGSTSRALVSTSRRESPTATSVALTTATYLPAYLVTSSLKCSTIQRSSLSMLIFHSTGRLLLLITIGPRPFSSQGTRFWGVGSVSAGRKIYD